MPIHVSTGLISEHVRLIAANHALRNCRHWCGWPDISLIDGLKLTLMGLKQMRQMGSLCVSLLPSGKYQLLSMIIGRINEVWKEKNEVLNKILIEGKEKE